MRIAGVEDNGTSCYRTFVRLEDLGLVGNCQISAHVERTGEVVWCCLPRFDSEPVFSTLLDPSGGSCTIAPATPTAGTQRYLRNTNVLETTFSSRDGRFRVLDFAPRFFEGERTFRPPMLVRIVEPIEGMPFVKATCDPKIGWSKRTPARVEESGRIRFDGFERPLHAVTDLPVADLAFGQPFALTGRRHLVVAWGDPPTAALHPFCDRYLGETVRYWQRWVKHTTIPSEFQPEVIRSALALKLHCFEDTGAIVAAMTTSIPEAPGSGRTWDYRYCWLRDAYYALRAFRRLGHFEERERFIQYLLNRVGATPSLALAPLYRIDGRSDLEERVLPDWAGFEGHGPVRVGNAASAHVQHDVFGEMVLALLPVFTDERFREEQSEETLDLVERLARKAIEVVGTPDAGIWEVRGGWKPQTFSSLMCWAAADRMAQLALRHRPARAAEFRAAADRIHQQILDRAWNAEVGAFVSTYDGRDLDASTLQMAKLHFLPPDDPRLHGTIDAIAKSLAREGWLFRYQVDDGFGVPAVAFVFCTFWLVEALATVGRADEARAVFDRARAALSPVGLLAEDYETRTLRMWGNFPQAYSHVGLIHAAFEAAPRWRDVD